jgi:hypothetical protein
MTAVLAARPVAAERRCAAALDGIHDLHLIEADVPGIGASPRRSMVAEYICDLLRRDMVSVCQAVTTGAMGRRMGSSCLG